MSDQPPKRSFKSKLLGNFFALLFILGYVFCRLLVWVLFTILFLPCISVCMLFFGTRGTARMLTDTSNFLYNYRL